VKHRCLWILAGERRRGMTKHVIGTCEWPRTKREDVRVA
jgi:hypothetical protein